MQIVAGRRRGTGERRCERMGMAGKGLSNRVSEA